MRSVRITKSYSWWRWWSPIVWRLRPLDERKKRLNRLPPGAHSRVSRNDRVLYWTVSPTGRTHHCGRNTDHVLWPDDATAERLPRRSLGLLPRLLSGSKVQCLKYAILGRDEQDFRTE